MSEAVEEITEAEVVEPSTESRALVHAPVALAVTPQVKASELVDRLGVIRDAAQNAMAENVDYGKIPGTDKPTLLKPGAEKLGVLFQLDVQLDNEKVWGPGDHLTVISRATVFHAPTGSRLGYGEGIATTREKKHSVRKLERACPNCGKHTIFKSKKDNEGWYCWRKKDGCGAQFAPTDERIVSQDQGEIENPDLPDLWNTVVKMAEKRARVDAVLAVTGASAVFTQDMEDHASVQEPAPPVAPFGEPFDKAILGGAVGAACTKLAGDSARGRALFQLVAKDCDGFMPVAAALALIHAADTENLVPHIESPEIS